MSRFVTHDVTNCNRKLQEDVEKDINSILEMLCFRFPGGHAGGDVQ